MTEKEIEQLEWELKYKEEQIKDLKEALAGTIREKGQRTFNFSKGKYEYSLNYSSILTKLIQEAGKICLSYASDLFILWNYDVEKKLETGELINETLKFGFRQNGVDTKKSVEHNGKDYYISIWSLEISSTEKEINMILKKESEMRH